MYKIKRFNKSDKDAKSKHKIPIESKIAGAALSGIGVKVLDDVHKKGELSGRVNLYHGTSAKAKKSILKEGLKASHSLDPDNLTNRNLRDLGIKDGRKLVYTGKKRSPAYMMALNQKALAGEDPAVVKMSIPYDEYKKMKRVYDNPEFGKLSKSDWVKKNSDGNFINDQILKKYYDDFSGNKGTSGTRIFEQDIDTKRIKGSKDYVKNSGKEVIDYIKKHPGRFAKGATKTAVGVGTVGAGVYVAHKGIKVKKSDKKK